MAPGFGADMIAMQPVGTCTHKLLLSEMEHFENDDETTDMGPGSASETESSSSLSGTEIGAVGFNSGSRCRFGCTRLETMPATPAGKASQRSPPGLSRAAMRQARDACGVVAAQRMVTAEEQTECWASGRQCRFGSTSLETIPATPPTERKLRALAKEVGSPPGLSRASMRQARDACKRDATLVTSWGGSSSVTPSSSATASALTPFGASLSTAAVRATKTRAAREAIVKAKQGASLFKTEADFHKKEAPVLIDELESGSGEQTTDSGNGNTSEESASESSSFSERRRCRFGDTTLETVPATPSGASPVVSCRSPPGLSRASMRHARDACKVFLRATSFTTLLSISPGGRPLTPSTLRSAKRRAANGSSLLFPDALSAEPR